MTPDIIMSVRIFLPSEGGRSTAVSGEVYGCPLFVEDEGFDCRLLLHGVRLELVDVYEVDVMFLTRDVIISRLSIGKEVLVWERKNVGVVHVINPLHSS